MSVIFSHSARICINIIGEAGGVHIQCKEVFYSHCII